MSNYEIITLIGLFAGPIIAVLITLWSQARQARRMRQSAIVTMFLNTHHDSSSADYSAAIRLIPIEFRKSKKVLAAWNSYMANVNFKPTEENRIKHNQEFLDRKHELLIAAARDVGLELKESDLRNMVYVAQANADLGLLELSAKQSLVRIADALEKLTNAQTH